MSSADNASADHTPRWGMVIDLNRCVGCQSCTIACKSANDLPSEVQWRSVLDVEQGEFPNVERLFLVVGCQHCAEPPCVPVCPSGATRQRADGLVTMDYDLCIGCGYCAVACPYQARTIVHDEKWYFGDATVQERQVHHDDRLGVANKCTFCIERIDEAPRQGLTPGLDPAVTPVCASSCITQAIQFGDFNDQDSHVSHMVAEGDTFQMHQELGTNPQIRYLVDTPTVPGREGEETDASDERLGDPANTLVGKLQRFWDIRAAINFILGGFGSGLVVMAYLLSLLQPTSWPEHAFLSVYIIAGAVMVCGLFSVFLEIGRKRRFMLVLLRPQSSWMSREAYAGAVFFPALMVNLVLKDHVLHTLIALAALAFLYCQARILHAAKGIPAWRVPLIPWMLISTGLFEGLGLLFVVAALDSEIVIGPVGPVLGVLLASVNAWQWWIYRKTAKKAGIPPLARASLARITPWLHAIGHALPGLLYITALTMIGEEQIAVLAVAGIASLAGGAIWKYTVVVLASYQQGFALPRLPRRGSGDRTAPGLCGTL